MTRAAEESNRRLLRACDAMDRTYAQPLDRALRDPFGDHIRTSQPAPGPSKVPDPAVRGGDAAR
jgi:hypothetical protein